MGDHHLLRHFAASVADEKEEALRDRVKVLTNQLEKTARRTRRLRRDLSAAAGQLGPPSAYLDDDDSNANGDKVKSAELALLQSRMKKRKRVGAGEAIPVTKKSAVDACKRVAITDRMELLKHVHGVVAATAAGPAISRNNSGGGDNVTTVSFSPCVQGMVLGPFKLCLTKKGKRWRVRTNEVPLPRSLLDLEAAVEALTAEDRTPVDQLSGDRLSSSSLSQFADRLSVLLNNFMSRKVQFEQITERFPPEVLVGARTSGDEYREVKFGLRTTMESDDDGDEGDGPAVVVQIRVRYADDSDRPDPSDESSVRVESEALSEEDLADLRDHCRNVFHDRPLAKAIEDAFN